MDPPATGPPPESLSYPDPKIKILNEAQRPSQTSHRSRRMIKASDLNCVSDQRQPHAHRRSIYLVGRPSAAWAGGCLRARQGVALCRGPTDRHRRGVDRVLELGGRVDIDPYDSQWGRIARVADPVGPASRSSATTARILAADLAPGSARVDDPYDD